MKHIAVIEQTGNGYGAYLPDLAGCIAAGDTLEETEQSIREAVVYHVGAMRENGDPAPGPSSKKIVVEAEAMLRQPVSMEGSDGTF